MADEVTSYWPDDFDVKVLSPLAVLRIQANALSAKTHGLLEADVVSATSQRQESHQLELIAPALNGERRTVLTATHSKNEPYPVRAEAAIFEPHPEDAADDPDRDWRPEAATVKDFTELVKQVLQSKPTRAMMQSLLARSQEVPATG
jgi:hypothetical protein